MQSRLKHTKGQRHNNQTQHIPTQEQTKENVTLSSFLKRELPVTVRPKGWEKFILKGGIPKKQLLRL